MVTVPVLTLLGRGEEAATLEGYGPIDPVTARQLAAEAPGFFKILTHPETGTVLSVGRNHYSAPAELRRWLRLRDGTCRGAGCNRGARNCELDHIAPWADGGTTSAENLVNLCKPDHRLKHVTNWRVERDGSRLVWISPAGYRYVTEPELQIEARPDLAVSMLAEDPWLPPPERQQVTDAGEASPDPPGTEPSSAAAALGADPRDDGRATPPMPNGEPARAPRCEP